MANILAGMSLQAIAEESLPVLQPMIPVLTAFNTDFSKDTAAAFAGISTRWPNATTASIYTRTNGYVPQDQTANSASIQLGDVLYSISAFTDYEVSTITQPRLFNTFLEGNMFAVVNTIFQGVTSDITLANFGSASWTGSNSSYNFGVDYGTVIGKLKTAGVTSQKSVVLNTPYNAALANDVKNNYQIGDSTIIRGGNIGVLGGVNHFESPSLPYINGLVGFACGKEAKTIATRQPVISVATGIEEVEQVNSGADYGDLTLQLRYSRNPWAGLTYVGYYILWGHANGNPNALTRITDGTSW